MPTDRHMDGTAGCRRDMFLQGQYYRARAKTKPARGWHVRAAWALDQNSEAGPPLSTMNDANNAPFAFDRDRSQPPGDGSHRNHHLQERLEGQRNLSFPGHPNAAGDAVSSFVMDAPARHCAGEIAYEYAESGKKRPLVGASMGKAPPFRCEMACDAGSSQRPLAVRWWRRPVRFPWRAAPAVTFSLQPMLLDF